jgi:hypothetical protein
MRAARFVVLFSLVAVLCLGGGVRAQEPVRTGSIEGTVQSKEGSNAGVEVTAIETATGQAYFRKTNEQGRFRFSGLPPGEFQVFAAAEGFYPVWETGTVDVETPWRPELSTETRVVREHFRFLDFSRTAIDIFRLNSVICFGVIKSVERLPESPKDAQEGTFRVTVSVKNILKGKDVPDTIAVKQAFGLLQTPSLRAGQEVLLLLESSVLEVGSGIMPGYLLFYPEFEARDIFLRPRMWQLFEMTRAHRVSRPELVKWLFEGIESGEFRLGSALDASAILTRSREMANSPVKKSGPVDPFDLADPRQPLFSEAQIKRMSEVVFQDDSMMWADLGVIQLLIDLEYPEVEGLLFAQIEKRKFNWTEPTGDLLRLHSSLRKETEPGRLAKLFEGVRSAVYHRVEQEGSDGKRRTPYERISKVWLLAGPHLSLILKSYLWTVEHPAKDTK